MKKNYKYLLDFYKLSPRYSFYLLLGSIASVLIQILTVVAVFPLMQSLGLDVSNEFAIKITSNFNLLLNYFNLSNNFTTAYLFMVFGYVSFSCINYGIELYSAKISARILRRLRTQTIHSYLNTDWSYYSRRGSGDAVQLIDTVCGKVAVGGYRKAILTLASLIQLFFLLGSSLFIFFDLTILMIFVSLSVSLFFMPFLIKSKTLGEVNRRLAKESTLKITDSLRGIKAVRVMGLQDYYESILVNINLKQEINSVDLFNTTAVTNNFRYPIMIVMISIMIFIAQYLGFFLVIDVLSVILIFERINKAVAGAQDSFQGFLKMLPFYQSFISAHTEMCLNLDSMKEGLIPTNLSNIVFNDVSFSYREYAILDAITFNLKCNSIYLFMGESGAGKSTVLDLITGLLTPTSGVIKVDGVDLNKICMTSWRKSIGYVPQDLFLFNDTIKNNVIFGRHHVSTSHLKYVLELSNSMGFIESKNNGLDYNVGEQGALLSGGQRQRLLIARALLNDPRILIFDEPTSALDDESSLVFSRMLKNIAAEGVIILLVSHDSVFRKIADKVYLVKGKKVILQ